MTGRSRLPSSYEKAAVLAPLDAYFELLVG